MFSTLNFMTIDGQDLWEVFPKSYGGQKFQNNVTCF